MKLQSNKNTSNKTIQEILSFVTNISNIEQIMPDSLSKFESSEDSFLFALKGMPDISLKLVDKTSDKLFFKSNKGKIDFELTLEVSQNDITEVQFLFDGKLNAMMQMMVRKPLQNLINTMSDKLSNI